MTDKLLAEINEKHPVTLLIDLVDNDEAVVEVMQAVFEMEGLSNVRMITNARVYKELLRAEPETTPNIAILDYDLDDPGINGIILTIMIMEQNPDAKVIMLTGMRNPNIMESFFNEYGGYKWVNKDREDWKEKLVQFTKRAIVFLKSEMEKKYRSEKLEGKLLTLIRTDREPLSAKNEKND